MDSIIQSLQDLLELRERAKSAPHAPLAYTYPPSLVKHAAEMFKSDNVYINGTDGSQYFQGVLIKAPRVESVDTTRLNERIAAMDLPKCLRTLSPAEREVHLLGKWNIEGKGE